MNKGAGQHLDLIDGFRGMLAFWVFAGHLMYMNHAYMILFAEPGSAVDLFMFISGFLMAWHWMEREASFSGVRDQSVDFFIRRFFRIAPLYYLLMIGALILQPDRQTNLTWQSILLHVTFLFGLFPKYVQNNLLPDWSIGLEAQFYMLFPLLMLLLRYAGAVVCVCIGVEAVDIAHGIFGKPGPHGVFSYPGLIFFKLNIFIAGMLLAKLLVSQREDQKNRANPLFFYALLIAYSVLATPTAVGRWAMFLVVVLVAEARYSGFVLKIFSCRLARFMGDVSYSVYLVHLLVFAVALPFLTQHVLPGKPPRADFAIALAILVVPVYAISYLLHRTIELPGIALGKKLTRRWKQHVAERNRLVSNAPVSALE